MTKPVTFRLDDDKLQFIDGLAVTMDRDRSYLLNEAVDNYIDLHRWQINEIRQAIAEADAGEFATDEEVRAAFDAFRLPS
jgi:predicted transcriptional regulator